MVALLKATDYILTYFIVNKGGIEISLLVSILLSSPLILALLNVIYILFYLLLNILMKEVYKKILFYGYIIVMCFYTAVVTSQFIQLQLIQIYA